MDTKSTKRRTANGLSLTQLRQQIRNWNNGDDDAGNPVRKTSDSPPLEQAPPDKRNVDNTARSTRSTDAWINIKGDSDSDSDGEDVFLSPKQGPSFLDKGEEPNISTPLDSNPSKDPENELEQIKKDREELRQQLTKARSELDVARSTFRDNVSDLKGQLHNMKQTEQRQKELKENTELQGQFDELARIAREQEEKSADDATTVGSEGAVKNTKKTREDLVEALNERENREQSLEEEIEKLKEQAAIDSKKLKESQRQVEWFQKELTAMFPEGDNSSVGSSETNIIANTTGVKTAAEDLLSGDMAESMEASNLMNPSIEESIYLSTIFDNYTPDEIRRASITSTMDEKRRASIISTMDEKRRASIKSTMDDVFRRPSIQSTTGIVQNDYRRGSIKSTKKTLVREESIGLSKVFDNYKPSASSTTQPIVEESIDLNTPSKEPANEAKKQDISPDPSNKHLKLLHKQRMELEQRVQQLLHEMGLMRIEHQKQQKDKQRTEIQVWQLQSDLEKQQKQHERALGKTERQLEEWKARATSLESDLNEGRKLAEHLKARRETERIERQELSQMFEQLEREKNELSDNLDKRRVDFENEKGLLTKEIQTLESKLAALSESQILGSWKKLVLRVQHLEAERDASTQKESALRSQLKTMTEQEKESKSDIATLEDRIRVLQTFLDALFSTSIKGERQRELREEYFSTHSRSGDGKDNNQKEIDDVDMANAINPESPKSAENVEHTFESTKPENVTFYDTPQKTNEQSTPLDLNPAPDFPKKPDIDEASISSDAVVHNLHSKLEEEMGHLVQKRKQLRRLRAATTEDYLGVGKLGLVNEQDFDTERSEDFELTETEKAKADKEMREKLHKENSRLGTALENANYKKAQLEIELGDALEKITISASRIDALEAEVCIHQNSVEKYEKEKDELADKLLISENEAASLKNKISDLDEEKKSLDATLLELKDALDATESAVLEKEELYRTELDEIKKELAKSARGNRDDEAHSKQIIYLEAKLLLVQEESKSNIQVLSKNLEGMLAERNTLESKLEDACKELEEVKASESVLRAAAQDIVEKLESIEKLSEAKELETFELEKMVAEKNHRIADTFKELEEVKASESALRAALQDIAVKFESIEKLSQAKELETIELEKTIAEKNQLIEDLEENLSSKGRRLEQAAMQMSELENDIFERDQEIVKLDAKRLEIQENASKQLIEMESLLGKDDEDIDKLEEEKTKLQELVQSQEHQIEKQQGRLAEASMQLSEMESELFSKDEEIEEMQLKINAMKALEAQRSEGSEGSEVSQESPGRHLESSNQTIQNQLDRQLQNVSKLTEQNDMWQLKLEKAYEEKEELLDRISSLQTEVTSLRTELEESTEKIKELNTFNQRLQEDLVCATEADEKNRVRISQMEEQKEALSEELESAMDRLAELQKQNGNSRNATAADTAASSSTMTTAPRSNKRTKRETSNEELSLNELRQQIRSWNNNNNQN